MFPGTSLGELFFYKAVVIFNVKKNCENVEIAQNSPFVVMLYNGLSLGLYSKLEQKTYFLIQGELCPRKKGRVCDYE